MASIGSTSLADMFEESRLDNTLLELPPLPQPPYLLVGIGLAIAIICGFTFSRLIQDRLDRWKQDRLKMLPLRTIETSLSYSGILLGVTLFIGGSLQVFGFAPGVSMLVSLLLSLATGQALWVQLEGLMRQVEGGKFRAVDFDNFDEFF